MMSCIFKHIREWLPVLAVAAVAAVLAGCRQQPLAPEPTANVFETVVPEEERGFMADSLDTEMRLQMEKEAVMQRVRDIYGVVRDEFLRRGSSVENELLDKAYCSESWNKLLMAVRYKEHLTGTLFFEVNHWSMMTDTDLVTFEEFELKDIYVEGPHKTATVAFTVYGYDTWAPAQIDLVYENGKWMIDNFHNLKYMLDVRERMWYYLQNDMM